MPPSPAPGTPGIERAPFDNPTQKAHAGHLHQLCSGFPSFQFLMGFHYWMIPFVAAALVTSELAFRRLLIGSPRNANLWLIVGSAVAYAASTAIQASPSILFQFFFAGITGIVAGCLYVLSGSLLISALYTGLLGAGWATANRIYFDVGLGDLYYPGRISDLPEAWLLPVVGAIFAAVLAYKVKKATTLP